MLAIRTKEYKMIEYKYEPNSQTNMYMAIWIGFNKPLNDQFSQKVEPNLRWTLWFSIRNPINSLEEALLTENLKVE